MEGNIIVKDSDFFNTLIKENTFVLFNPPYGERLTLPIEKFYEEVDGIRDSMVASAEQHIEGA